MEALKSRDSSSNGINIFFIDDFLYSLYIVEAEATENEEDRMRDNAIVFIFIRFVSFAFQIMPATICK